MSEIQIKPEIPFRPFPAINREQLRAYATASGDPNPIHLDEEKAKSVGLPGIIAHGMLISALIAIRAEDYVKNESGLGKFRLLQYKSRFKAMVFLGDVPSIGGVVKDWDQEHLVLELKVKNQKDEVTTLGTVKFKRI